MAAGGVSLLLFEMRAGMDFWRKQQNGGRRGLIVAFRDASRNGFLAEATKWQLAGSHCCFLRREQEWIFGGSSKMAAGRSLLMRLRSIAYEMVRTS